MSASDPYLRPIGAETEGVRVRPDLIRMGFECAVEGLSPGAALEHLRNGIALLERGLGAPAFEEAPARIQLLDVAATRRHGKSKRKASGRRESTTSRVTLGGEVRVALPPALDFWARAAVVAELTELARALRKEGKRTDPEIVVSYARPEPRVADPEAHRDALVAAWVKRARALAEAAQSTDAPLHIRKMSPPGAIRQQAISLEEVALVLEIEARIDTRPDRR